ncbi:MAG: hypothetical protein RLZ98_387 [Pseudomonadota bacterium]|jgi:putative NADPH-quinone reductase
MSNIVIIQGHPDPSGKRYCHALAEAYMKGAREAGHKVTYCDLGQLEFPLLRTEEDWKTGVSGTPECLKPIQAAALEADHFVFIYPLWMGTMPALLKAFLEQVFRPGVALKYEAGFPKGMLAGTSARIIITMGMPAIAYRWYFFAHSLKSFERNILGLVGIRPIRSTLLGMIDSVDKAKREKWLADTEALGRAAR